MRLTSMRNVLLAGLVLTLGACGAGTSESSGSSETSPCVTSVTTIPGDVFCAGFDLDSALESEFGPATGSDASDCPLEPIPAGAGRPADGWLGTETSGPTQQLNLLFDAAPAAGHPDRIRLIEAAGAAVPAGFEVTSSDALGDLQCPKSPIVISARFENPDGEEISVLWTHLRAQIEWFNEPLGGEVARSALEDGTEVVANDFNGLGQKHRVWAARQDGSVIKVIVAGANAPSQAGWPTTTTRFDSDIPEAVSAPLSLAETTALALTLLE